MPRAKTTSRRIAQLIREGRPDGHGQAGAIAYRETREGKVQRNPPLQGIKQLGANMTELEHGDLTVLYSYSTPVALLAPSGLYRTSTHHSNTTSKHIGKWFQHHGLDPKGAHRISQEVVENAVRFGHDPGETHIGNPPRIVYKVGQGRTGPLVKVYWTVSTKNMKYSMNVNVMARGILPLTNKTPLIPPTR